MRSPSSRALMLGLLVCVALRSVAGSCSDTTKSETGCSTDACLTTVTCDAGYVVNCANAPVDTGDGMVPTETTCTTYTGNAGETVTPTATCQTGCTTSTVVASDSLYLQQQTATAACTSGAVALKCFCHSPWGVCGQDQTFDSSDGTSCSLYIPQTGGVRRRTLTIRRRNGAKIYALCQVPQPTGAPSFSPTFAPSFTPTGAPSVSPTFAPSAAPTTYPTREGDILVTVQITQTLTFSATLTTSEEAEVKQAYKDTLTAQGVDGNSFAVSLTLNARRSVSYTISAVGQTTNSTSVSATCGSAAFASTFSTNIPGSVTVTTDPCTTDEGDSGGGSGDGSPTAAPTAAPTGGSDDSAGFFDDPIMAWGMIAGAVASLLAAAFVCVLIVRKCRAPVEEPSGWFSSSKKGRNEDGWFGSKKKAGWFAGAHGDESDSDGDFVPAKPPKDLQQKMILSMMGGPKLTSNDRAMMALTMFSNNTESKKKKRHKESKSSSKVHPFSPDASDEAIDVKPPRKSAWGKVSGKISGASKSKSPPRNDPDEDPRSPTMRSKYKKIKLNGATLTLDDVPIVNKEEMKALVVKDGRKKAFQKLALCWHPDKFGQKFGAMLEPGDEDAVWERVEDTYQMVQEMTRSEKPGSRGNPTGSSGKSPSKSPARGPSGEEVVEEHNPVSDLDLDGEANGKSSKEKKKSKRDKSPQKARR
eukprot:TRINITY_DN5495_c0_g1_i16.p1 TRINITY_DN5495_c0_g1~~TRINITY_DN5495_c0_g1_i16.p1  ORF type:complete len:698 (+),score=132.49 TRINITY_DN5495_c0_g1_i16:47-2140(+)